MKYLLLYKLFENKEEFNYHLQSVKDIFQDIFDEYNIYEYEKGSSENGYFWSILSKNTISMSFAIWHNVNGEVSSPGILQLIDFDILVERLKSIGYKIEKQWRRNNNGYNTLFLALTIDYSKA